VRSSRRNARASLRIARVFGPLFERIATSLTEPARSLWFRPVPWRSGSN